MPYSVNNTDSSLNFTVQDGAVDSTALSISLIGTNAENYADDLARNDVQLLENFASTSAPTAGTVLTGQLWYDKTDNVLRVYNGNANGWVNLQPLVLGTAPTGTGARSNKKGELYFDTSNNKFYIYDGAQWRPTGYGGEVTSEQSSNTDLNNPTKFGSKVRSIFLKDTSGVPRPCLALVFVNNSTTNEFYGAGTGGETIMAIFNHTTTFTADNVLSETEGENINYYAELNATNGIGVTINKGMNLRKDYVAEAVSLATEAVTAQKANALFRAGQVVAASSIITEDISFIPTGSAGSLTLGSSSQYFDTLFAQRVKLGDGGQAEIETATDNLGIIGSTSKYWKDVYSYDFHAKENVNVGAILAVTGNSNLVGNVDMTNNLQVDKNITSDQTITGATFTDGTLQINSGSIGSAINGTFSGTVSFGTLTDGALAITQFDGGVGLGTANDRLPTQNAVKTYVDTANANMKTYVDLKNSQQDLDIATDSGSIDILVDSEILTIAGGDGIGSTGAGTTVTMNVDNTVARTNVNETFDANVIITGNLTVSGTTTTVNSATLSIADNLITLNSDYTGSGPSENAGIEVERGTQTNVKLRWNETADKWQITNNGSAYFDIPVSTSDLAEGTNLYYTDGRADARVTAGFAAKSTSNLPEGSNLYYTDARVLTKIQATTLTNMSDVNYGTPNDGQTLQWNAGNSRFEAVTPSSGVTTLVNLTDVNGGTGASTGQVLSKLANGEFGFNSVSSTNNYADSLAFATGTGILTVGRNGLSDLTVDLDGRYSTTDTQYSVASNSALGLIKIGYTDNAKNYALELDGDNEAYVNVPWTDTVYSLPLAASGTRGGVKIGYTENGKNYPVELSSEKMYVNVPWTDSNDDTLYSAGSGVTKNTAGTTAGAFSHYTPSSVATNLTASGRTYITGMTFDTYGHVTGYTTGTESNQDVTNNYLNGASFNTGNGVLTLTRSGLGSVTVDLDGRFVTSSGVTSVSGGNGLSGTVTSTGSLNIESNLIGLVDYIGGDGPTHYIDMSSGAAFKIILDSVTDFQFNDGGTFHADGDVIAYSTITNSDIKLKDNVQKIEGALEMVQKLDGVSFTWKKDGRESAGVIAQNVEEILPSAVKDVESIGENEGETYKVVDYNQLSALFIESIKELKAEIEELKKQLNEK